ncbi:MAG TPA: hypothetical protein PLV92_29785 [Pirellulaceae bacterium]|nr:hypothetical protein [Pirellulaceae bacterium]
MADEFAITLGVDYANGTLTHKEPTRTFAVDQADTTPNMVAQVLTIGTSEEDIPVGGVAAPGFCTIENLDGTNYVEYGPKSGGAMILLGQVNAGDPPNLVRLGSGVTLRAKAHTAACRVKVTIYEA